MTRDRIDRRTAERGRSRYQQHFFGREHDHAQQPQQSARTPAHAVYTDPLAARGALSWAGHARPHDCDLDDGPITEGTLDSGQIRSPSDELRVGRRPVRSAYRQEDHGLDQARLSGGVRPPHDVRSPSERDLERPVPPQVTDRQ